MIKIILNIVLPALLVYSSAFAYENPFFTSGKTTADGLLGSFSQNNTGDCFFLASLIAIAEDAEGKTLIESAITQNNHQWLVTFPVIANQPVSITKQELQHYRLTDSDGKADSKPVLGDPDVKILEIAADKLWKSRIKAEGLWDDVPMNALYMFSSAPQLLIWNRAKASPENTADIDKYKRIPAGVVEEINISSPDQARNILKAILSRDNDGISMILIDYINYHADAIIDIDFVHNKYSYIDTTLTVYHNQNLDTLLQGLENGQYAINYIEISKPSVSLNVHH